MPNRIPASEQRAHVSHWRSTTRSQADFARSIGVSAPTFCRWVRRYPLSPTKNPPFIELTPPPKIEPFSVHLGRPGELLVALHFPSPPPVAWFSELIQAVSAS